MMRCKEVAKLVSSDFFTTRSLIKRMEVRLHLMMCEHCSRLLRQLKELRAAARGIAGLFDHELDQGTGQEMETRILRKISHDHQDPP